MLRRLLSLAVAVPLLTACPPPRPEVAQAPPPAPPPPVRVAEPAPTTPQTVAPAVDPAERQRALAEAQGALEARIHFDYDRADIRADARDLLDRKLTVLGTQPQIRLRIEGHADERGSDEYNLALGMRRALAARQYLSDRGIDGVRLDVMSHGEEQPFDAVAGEAAWARNRRAEFIIVAGQVIISD